MSLNNNQNESINDGKDLNINEDQKEDNQNPKNVEQNSNLNGEIEDKNLNENNYNNDENLNNNNKEDEKSKEDNVESKQIIESNNNKESDLITTSEDAQNNFKANLNSYMTSIDIVTKNYCMFDLDNCFAIFKLKNGHLYLTYPLLNSFICYDLTDENIVTTIKNAHEFYVLNFRYLYDSFSKRDLLQTISGENNNIKLWNIETWECLISINANKFGIMFSACFLYDDVNKENYLVSSNCTGNNFIQVFDLKGKKIKDVPYHEKHDKDEINDNELSEHYSENENDNNNNNDDESNNENNNKSENDNNESINSDEQIEEDKSINSNDFNNENNNIIKVYEKIDEPKDNIKNIENNNINKEKEYEEVGNSYDINNVKNFFYKCYPEDDKDNDIINNTKTDPKNKKIEINSNININNIKDINYKENKDDYKNETNIESNLNEELKIKINNENIYSNHFDINNDVKMLELNINENGINENNKDNENNDYNNKENNQFNINNEKLGNEINTSDKEIKNNMEIEADQKINNNNDNLNSSNNADNNSDNNNEIRENQDDPPADKIKVDHIYYIDSYFDIKLNITYIISCCSEFIKSFNFNLNILYHIYLDETTEKNIHGSAIIDDRSNNIVRLIECCIDGYVRIWDFHLGILLNKIKICNEGINSICLWNENHIIIGCNDATIKMVDINKNEIIHVLYGHKQRVCCIKIIEHEKYGKCIISKGWGADAIKLWKKKDS